MAEQVVQCLAQARRGTRSVAVRFCTTSPRWLRVSAFISMVPAIGLRRRHLGYLPVYGEDVTGACRAGPFESTSEADQSTRQRNTAVHQKTHGDGRRVPAASDESLEESRFGKLSIKMEGLGIELRGEGFDLCLVECVRAGHELLADGEIIEIENVLHAPFLRRATSGSAALARPEVHAKFTSCNHSGPEGGARFSTGAEGTMNAVRLSTPTI